MLRLSGPNLHPIARRRGGTASASRFLSPLDISLLFFGWGRAALSTRETSDGPGQAGGEPGGRAGLVAGGVECCHLLGLWKQYGVCLQGMAVPEEAGQDGPQQKENKHRFDENVVTPRGAGKKAPLFREVGASEGWGQGQGVQGGHGCRENRGFCPMSLGP